MRYVRLWRRFFAQAVVRETHYRAHFLTTLLVGLVQLGLGIVPTLLLFGFTAEVHGWSRAEVIALVGVYQVVTGLMATFVAPNLNRMTSYLTEGELDAVLLRPVSSQFYLTFRWINVAELSNVASGIIVLVFGLIQSGLTPNVGQVLQSVVLGICGLVLLTAVWSAMAYLAFWLQSVGPIGVVYLSVVEAGRYPLTFFPVPVRGFLTFAFPVAFATTYPVQALAGDLGWGPVALGTGLSVVAVLLIRLLWQRGIRTYASASS
ncbi:ABC transporter permease [Kribbella sp. NPDC020789]